MTGKAAWGRIRDDLIMDKLRRGEISRAQAAVMTGEMGYVIKQAKQRLARVLKDAEKKVEEADEPILDIPKVKKIIIHSRIKKKLFKIDHR